jgi:predicted transglutaminase-like cysteine proteinase
MRSMSMALFGAVVALNAAGCAKGQEKAATSSAPTHQTNSPQGAADWRARMQNNHNADSSTEQQVRRLTRDLALTSAQQEKVRQLSRDHNDRIQTILDTAPPTLTYQDFQTRVHAISQQFHDSVNTILTPHQLQLMKAMVGRLDSGTEARHAPPN